jgi:tryptophanyl-tRNA synthetase
MKTLFSGIQPSGGAPSLGNYVGALRNWVKLQERYFCVYSIVDMHAITIRHDAAELRKNCRDMLAFLIATGIDPEASVLYYQSAVPAHAELAWILNCYTYMGELSRMTQFKEKSKKHQDNINAGLFTYPVLQAADILLYNAGFVPVGEDQRQHLELSRDIAIRFNNMYGDVFTVPEALIPESGAKIKNLQDPSRKMSKSDGDGDQGVIYMLDPPDSIASKIKRAVTDSESEVRYSETKPGVSNLLDIYSVFTDKTIAEAEKDFAGVKYGPFKNAVAETVAAALSAIQSRYREISADSAYLDKVIASNTPRAAAIAEKTLKAVKERIGFPL